MGVWVLIYVKFWGGQCSLVKVCQKDFIFKDLGGLDLVQIWITHQTIPTWRSVRNRPSWVGRIQKIP